eukprot:m.126720 g.126720  ORF g.126720 m.126720 type:complete len:482 (+) comp19825_c0_seq2:23-1468(+)
MEETGAAAAPAAAAAHQRHAGRFPVAADKPEHHVPDGFRRYALALCEKMPGAAVAELEAVAALYNVPLRCQELDAQAEIHYLLVDAPDDGHASITRIVSRLVCVHFCVELWGFGASKEACLQAAKMYSAEKVLVPAETTHKFFVNSYGRKCPPERKLELAVYFSELPIKSKVELQDPQVKIYVLEDYGHAQAQAVSPREPLLVYLGQHVCAGARHHINALNLKERRMIGNTSMDPELALLMANLGWAAPGRLVYDLFVGTASILYPCAQFGAYVMGSDLDYQTLHGTGKTPRAKVQSKARGPEENIHATFEQYGLSKRFLGVLLMDSSKPVWHQQLFDAIITDPPYGIREGAKKITTRTPEQKAASLKRAEEGQTTFMSSEQYGLTDVYFDLLEFAARRLVLNGKLVYWLPVIRESYKDSVLPSHPCMRLESNIEQTLTRKLSRRLITMIKVLEPAVDQINPVAHKPDLDVRTQLFEKQKQ